MHENLSFEKFETASSVTLVFFQMSVKNYPNKTILVLNLSDPFILLTLQEMLGVIYLVESSDINNKKDLRISTLL